MATLAGTENPTEEWSGGSEILGSGFGLAGNGSNKGLESAMEESFLLLGFASCGLVTIT